LERIPPHRVDVGAQLGQVFGVQPEIVPRAAPFFLHQSGGLQGLQMLRYGWAGDRKVASQLADRRRALAKEIDNGLARGMREGAQQLPSVSHTLP